VRIRKYLPSRTKLTVILVVFIVGAGFLSRDSVTHFRRDLKLVPMHSWWRMSFTGQKYTIGNATIRISNAKTRFKAYPDQEPWYCATWLSVEKNGTECYQIVEENIDPAGGEFGIFVPHEQPLKEFFLAASIVGYGHTMVIVDKNANVNVYEGDSCFVTHDGKYLVIGGYSDSVIVFDTSTGKDPYTSVPFGKRKHTLLPFYPFQWYYSATIGYFCTEWVRENSGPNEGNTSLQVLNLQTGRFNRIKFDVAVLTSAEKIEWDFDPANYPDCACNN
jgi:hypothetical protein